MKLKKMLLHDEHEVMNVSEMKQVVGGYAGDKTCPSGEDDLQCFGDCTVTVVKGGKTYIMAGTCYHSGIGSICACVVD